MAVRIRDDVPQGTARGNGCYACGVGQSVRKGERWVDFEQMIDFEGWLVMCGSCICEAGRLLGLVDADEARTLEADLHKVQAEADDLLAERNEALALVQALRRFDERQPAPPDPPAFPHLLANVAESVPADDAADLPVPAIDADSVPDDVRHYKPRKPRAK